MITALAWASASARLTGLLMVHPLWRASFPRGVGLVVAAAFAISLIGAAIPLEVLFVDSAGILELPTKTPSLSTASLAATLGVEFALGTILGAWVSLPFLGVVGGVRWAGSAAGSRGVLRRPWVRLHLLLTGWLFVATAPATTGIEGLLRLSGLRAAGGLQAHELLALLGDTEGLLDALKVHAEASLLLAVTVCAPAIVAGAVVNAIADLGAVGQPRFGADIEPVRRSVAMVVMVVAWTASWGLASEERAWTLAPGVERLDGPE